jgi:hypothetical protein
MTSTQTPHRPYQASEDPATYERLGLPVPRLIQVREHQAYKDWVEEGGLERFANKHNVKVDFMYYCCETKGEVVAAYISELTAIPGLPDIMIQPWTGPLMSYESAQNAMAYAEGWSTSEDEAEDEDDKEQTEIQDELEGNKEEGVKATALNQEMDVSRKT